MSGSGYETCSEGIILCLDTCDTVGSNNKAVIRLCYEKCHKKCSGSGVARQPNDDPSEQYDNFCANQGMFVGKVDSQTAAYWNVYCEEKKSMEKEAAQLAKQHEQLLEKEATKTDTKDLLLAAAKVLAEQVAMIQGMEFIAPKIISGLLHLTGHIVMRSKLALQYYGIIGQNTVSVRDYILQITNPDELSNTTLVLLDNEKFSNQATTSEEGFTKIAGNGESWGYGWGWNSYVRKPFFSSANKQAQNEFGQAIQEAAANRIAKNSKLFEKATEAGAHNEGLIANAKLENQILEKLDLGKKSMAWFLRDPATFNKNIDEASAKLADELSDLVIKETAGYFAQSIILQAVISVIGTVVAGAMHFFGQITMIGMFVSAVLDSIDPCDLKKSMHATDMIKFTGSYNKSFRDNMLVTEGSYVDSFGHVFHTEEWPVRLNASDSGLLQFNGPPGRNVQNYLESRGLPLLAELNLHPNSVDQKTGSWNFYTNLHGHLVKLYLHSLDFNSRGELIKHPTDPRMYPPIPRACAKDIDCNNDEDESNLCKQTLLSCSSNDQDKCSDCVASKNSSSETSGCTTADLNAYCYSPHNMPFYQVVTLAQMSPIDSNAMTEVIQSNNAINSGKLAYNLNAGDTELVILLVKNTQRYDNSDISIGNELQSLKIATITEPRSPSQYKCNGSNLCVPNVPESHNKYCRSASLNDFINNPSCTSISSNPSDFLGFFMKASDAISEFLMPNNTEIQMTISNLLPLILVGALIGIYFLFIMIK